MLFGLAVIGALVLNGWVAYDAERRGRSVWWSRLVFFTGIFGLLVWLVVRRRAPVTVERLGAARTWRLALANLRFLVLTALTLNFITSSLFQVARIEGHAMEPTLADQDRVFVDKVTYALAEARRGDIVMLRYPLNPHKLFVKRVIAEEGDMVRIVDGRVSVNDLPLLDDYVPQDFRSHDDWGPQVIPEGYCFVMGDHRNNSSDSRHWGFLPNGYIVGKIKARWWPIQHARVY